MALVIDLLFLDLLVLALEFGASVVKVACGKPFDCC